MSAGRGPDPVPPDTSPIRMGSDGLLFAQLETESPDAPSTSQSSSEAKPLKLEGKQADAAAREALARTREFLTDQDSIRATVKETVSIGGRRFTTTGRYLKGEGLKLRLEFELKAGGTSGSLLEVCDGQRLWTRYKVGDTERITRRDVVQILRQAATLSSAPQSVLSAELGLGGLQAIIASLERSMTFNRVSDETVNDRAVTVIQGVWNSDYRNQFAQQAEDGSSALPPYVPDIVRIYIDQDTEFPRRISYLKKQNAAYRNMVSLDFSNIELNTPINPSEFDFVPPDNSVPEDVTQSYLSMLRQNQAGEGSGGENPAAPQNLPDGPLKRD